MWQQNGAGFKGRYGGTRVQVLKFPRAADPSTARGTQITDHLDDIQSTQAVRAGVWRHSCRNLEVLRTRRQGTGVARVAVRQPSTQVNCTPGQQRLVRELTLRTPGSRRAQKSDGQGLCDRNQDRRRNAQRTGGAACASITSCRHTCSGVTDHAGVTPRTLKRR